MSPSPRPQVTARASDARLVEPGWSDLAHGRLAYGNVITIEPGVYVPTSPEFPSHFHGLGVRIEDDVALTERGMVILSANAPKEVVDVEAACQGFLDRP